MQDWLIGKKITFIYFEEKSGATGIIGGKVQES